jgi:hypothetical protein
MACSLDKSITLACDDKFIGGLKNYVYIGSVSELATPINVSSPTDVTTLSFGTYQGLVKFETKRNQLSSGQTGTLAPSGDMFFTHEGLIKVFAKDATDDAAIEDVMGLQDIFIVSVSQDGVIRIYGGENGGRITEYTQNTGQDSSADVAHTLTFNADGERYLPKRFSTGGGLAADIAYLDARVV